MLFSAVILLGCAPANKDKVILYTIGDSTMSDNLRILDDPGDPGRGWGQELGKFFDSDRLVVKNNAVSGRSTKSYIDEGRWDKLKEEIQPGNYVLIQFGGNDQKDYDPKRYTDPETTFKDNFRKFINETREKKGVPLLATSVARRRWNEKGELVDTYGRYVEVVRELATEMDIPVIDMQASTRKLIEEYGVEDSKKLFLWVEPGVAERFPEGNKDDTHLNVLGATEFSRLFVKELKEINHPLAKYVRSDMATIK